MNYDQVVSPERVQKVIKNLAERGIEAMVVDTSAQALEKITSLIPQGASVMNGSSTTLQEIGFIDYLKSEAHGWNNLHAKILAEKDPAKQAQLRKESVLSDYYVGSVHALAETGEFLIASNSGSQLPHIVFTSPNLIFVVGTQKITPTLADGFERLVQYVVPLEDKRMKSVGMGGTYVSKVLTFFKEQPFMQRKVRMILVNEKLGF